MGAVLRGVGRAHPSRDLALWAAGLSFFGIIGIVPLVMVSVALAALLVGNGTVASRMDLAVSALPGRHGAGAAVNQVTAAALDLSLVQLVVLLFPATLYGEGLRRAFLQFSRDRADAFTGWRGRAALLPMVAMAPVFALVFLAAAPRITPMYVHGGWRLVLGVVIAFHLTFVLLSAALVLVYGFVGPDRVGLRPLVGGACCSAAMVAGFSQGFLVFLAIPLDWSAPFGGLPVLGALVALSLWLYLLHVLVLLGYRLSLVLEARRQPTR